MRASPTISPRPGFGFFRPGDLRDLALARVVLAGAYLVVLNPDPGEALWLAREGSELAFRPIPALKVLLLPFGGWGIRPDPLLIGAVWGLSMAAAALVLVGFRTRPATFVWAASYTVLVAHDYSFSDFHHPEAPFAIALWIFAFSRWGGAVSLDRILRRRRAVTARGAFAAADPATYASPEATWPLRGVQWVLALSYTSAGLYKVVRGGTDWLNGHTLSYYLIRDGIRWDRPLALVLADLDPLVTALSGLTVAYEATFLLAVLVPVLSIVYIPLGIAMHTGIWYLMHADFPQWMALYVCFLPSLRHAWRVLRSARADQEGGPTRSVVYDGRCLLCLRTMVVLDELDTRDDLVFVDAHGGLEGLEEVLRGHDVLHGMRVVERDGTVQVGFEAFRSVAHGMPLLWPTLPLLHAPGSARLGRRVYETVARRRQRCSTGACAVPGVTRPSRPGVPPSSIP